MPSRPNAAEQALPGPASRSQLLSTRLHIPAMRAAVRRPRLLAMLDAALERKLTLVSASAGFGKSTLLADWLAQRADRAKSPAAAWLSLDEGDSEPARFLAYTAAALQTIDPYIGRGLPEALLAASAPDTQAALIALFNDVVAALEGPPARSAILVLDDYHVIDNPAIDDALAFMLEYLPPALRLVVLSRADPMLPLARLRASGQIAEIRERDLRFTPAEARAFLRDSMGLALPAADADALCARTEGWAAGLQLAALALQSAHGRQAEFIAAFSGTHRYIIDYLTDEVFQHQPDELQRFLLETSVLNRMSAALCDHVRAASGSQQVLEALEQKNLFIVPLDYERGWYRYHHLLADLLRLRLAQSGPGRAAGLHARAGEWYARYAAEAQDEDAIVEAVHHALAAPDHARAAALLEQFADGVWERGRHDTLRRWLAALPPDVLAAHPRLGILHAWLDFTLGRYAQAEAGLLRAEQALAGQPPQPELHGRIAAARAFIATFQADPPRVIRLAEQALSLLAGQPSTWRGSAAIALGDSRSLLGQTDAAGEPYQQALAACQAAGNRYMALNAAYKLAANLRQRGNLPQAHALCSEHIALAERDGLAQTAMAGCLVALRGDILCEWNQMPEALSQTRLGLAAAAQAQHIGFAGWAHLYRARCLLAARDFDAADETLRGLADLAQTAPLPPWIASPYAALRALLAMARGDMSAALAWAQERGLAPDDAIDPAREFEHLTLARLLALQRQFEPAQALLSRLLESAQAGGRVTLSITICSMQAVIHQVQGRPSEAGQALAQALKLGEPGRFTRAFLDAGPMLLPLLSASAADGPSAAYARRILAAAAPVPADSHSPGGLLEPLSEREREVLRLIAAGLKNQEIAGQLVISLNTVLYHAKNLYGKLGVRNRTQAAQRARELGLL